MRKNNYINSTVIPDLIGNPVECKAILPLDSRVKPENDIESGRSMLEMLGVLAVMGILSIVGISGFKSAMNKHRANELLNEASKRATVVAMQFATGKETASLSEFLNNDFGYAKFNSEASTANNKNQFIIAFEVIPSQKICEKMKNIIGASSQIRKISNDCSEITFNKDLSSIIWASDYENEHDCTAGHKKWCSASDKCVESDCCSEWQIPNCQLCNSETGALTQMPHYKKCDFDNDGVANDGFCHYGICKRDFGYCDKTNPLGNCMCDNNDDCGGNYSGYYCSWLVTKSEKNTGFCIKSNITSIDIEINGQKKTFYLRSSDGVNDKWDGAQNFCQSIGKKMLAPESLQCYHSGSAVLIDENQSSWEDCCDKNQTCAYTDWANRNTNGLYSPILVELAKKIPLKSYWLSSQWAIQLNYYGRLSGEASQCICED